MTRFKRLCAHVRCRPSNAAYNYNLQHPIHFHIAGTSGCADTMFVLGRQSASQCAALCGIRLGDFKNMGKAFEIVSYVQHVYLNK